MAQLGLLNFTSLPPTLLFDTRRKSKMIKFQPTSKFLTFICSTQMVHRAESGMDEAYPPTSLVSEISRGK